MARPGSNIFSVELSYARNWSAGGSAVLSNLQFASETYGWLGKDEAVVDPMAIHGFIHLVPRNIVPLSLIACRSYVYMPQNAWPWLGHIPPRRRCARWLALRGSSSIALRSATAVVRLSRAVPSNRRKPSIVLPNTLDIGFETASAHLSPRESVHRNEPVLFLGSLATFKGIPELLKGYDLYKRAGGALGLRLIGSATEPGVLDELTRWTRRVPQLDILPTTIARPQALSLMTRSSAVIMPSRVEASPLTSLEALALANQLIVSDIPGHRDTLRGYIREANIFQPRCPSSIARALLRAERGETSVPPNPYQHEPGRRVQRALWAKKLNDFFLHLLDPQRAPFRT